MFPFQNKKLLFLCALFVFVYVWQCALIVSAKDSSNPKDTKPKHTTTTKDTTKPKDTKSKDSAPKDSTTKSKEAKAELFQGKPKCSNGLNRCIHVWETQFAGVDPYDGNGICASAPGFPLKDYEPVCQLNVTVSDAVIVNCDSSGKNNVEIVYKGRSTGMSSIGTSGSARAVFSRTKPKDVSALKSGDQIAPDVNMDVWVYCYDVPTLSRIDAKGKIAHGSPNCGNGKSRCLSFYHTDYNSIDPVKGNGTCINTYPDPLPDAFVDTCSITQQGDVRWTVICEARGENGLDITYDKNGNGKAIATGKATALFAQKPPNLNALKSGTVTSSIANENVYLFCPPTKP